MTLARWQATITDNTGNVLPGAALTVRYETIGASLAVLYTDRAGTIFAGNPVYADADGFVFFYTLAGLYRLQAVSGSNVADWRYVPVGGADLPKSTFTLTAGATTTVVIDVNCSETSVIQYMPTTAHAASSMASTSIVVGFGAFTITHANNAFTDRIFTYAVL